MNIIWIFQWSKIISIEKLLCKYLVNTPSFNSSIKFNNIKNLKKKNIETSQAIKILLYKKENKTIKRF